MQAYVTANAVFAEKTLDALRTANENMSPDAPPPLVWIHGMFRGISRNIHYDYFCRKKSNLTKSRLSFDDRGEHDSSEGRRRRAEM